QRCSEMTHNGNGSNRSLDCFPHQSICIPVVSSIADGRMLLLLVSWLICQRGEALGATTTSLIIFAVLVGGVLVGALLRRVLPEHHLDTHAKDVVRLGCALIATISGLVLGLL